MPFLPGVHLQLLIAKWLIKKQQNNHNPILPSLRMKSEQKQQQACSFCAALPADRRHLLSALLRSLSRHLSLPRPSSGASEGQGFRQLLRVVFGGSMQPNDDHCQHRRYYTYFINKLKCNEHDLQLAAQGLAEKIAEKNYHLQLLSLQVKNAAESIAAGNVDGTEGGEGGRGLRKRSSKKSRATNANSEREIKVEQEEKGEGGKGQEEERNAIGYLPLYNSEFAVQEQRQLQMGNLNNISFFYPQYPLFFPPPAQ